MTLRDFDFCETKGGKAFGPYSQELGGCIYFVYIPDLLYSKRMGFDCDWSVELPDNLLLPRELM